MSHLEVRTLAILKTRCVWSW